LASIIAGIVLTIGMAVDANVIIFERVREELREGKSMKSAVADAFKYSYSAIIDANVTTLLVAIVLAYFGLGPIKGFAVVLIIGVLSSLFTAVLMGRLIIEWWINKGRSMSFWTGASKNVLADLNIDWLKKRKIAYGISSVIIIAGIISFFTLGFDYSVDFTGGYAYNVEFEQDIDVSVEELRTSLEDVFGSAPNVKAVDGSNTYQVVTKYLINESGDDVPGRVMGKLHEGVNNLLGGTVVLEQFELPDGEGTHVSSSSKVTPTIADDIKRSSIYAGIFALLLIFLYIFVRFNRWQYSLGAVAALVHDSLVVLAIFSLCYKIVPFALEIDQFVFGILMHDPGHCLPGRTDPCTQLFSCQ
jgi:SecD/SecF fusion protein